MNTTNYKQYDTRWAKLPYKDNPDNIGNNGCGMVAVCNSIIEMVSQMNQTPETMQPYCRQFACHDGTYWSAIPTMLKHYGCTEVMEHQTMASLWKELAKGDRVAVYMMNSRPGGSKGIHWTSGGHFVCSVAYKKENGLHKVYVKDSNSTSKDRNGWISYEENMRGDVSACWSGKLNGSSAPTPDPPTPTGKLVVDGIGGYETVKRLQEFLKLKDPDGLIGRQRKANAKWYPSLTAVSFATSGGSKTVTALQKWLGLSGPDGILGKNTTGALQKRLRDYGYLAKDETIDAVFGTKSMKALQTALNNDFKKVTPPTPPTPTPTKDTKVIDVSAFQDSINWAKVKAAGIDGAMIRCGYRGYETGKLNQDKMFADHIKGASKAGLKVGVYFFTEAINYSEGKQEAEYTLGLIEKMGIQLYYPIAVDTEAQSAPNERAKNLSKAQRTEAIRGFCETIASRGGRPMIYASTTWFENKLDMSKLPYDVWCAQYYKECQYKGKYVMWQYTSEGSVSGVKGVVDMNKCYITSPAPMPTPTPKPEPTPEPTPTPSDGHYQGKYPEVRVKRTNKQVIEYAIKWAKWIASMNDFHYGHGDHAHHNGCYFCNTQGAKKGHMKLWQYTYCCNPFVHAAWAHGGLIPKALQMCDNGKSWDFNKGSGYDASDLFDKLGKPAQSKLKAGDVLCSDSHVALYIGNGKVVQAGHEDDNVIGSSSWNSSISVGSWGGYKRAYRFNGSVNADIIIRKGEVSERVADLQRYLVWYGALPEDEIPDGIYGEKTFTAVVDMQTDFFGKAEADGTVGNKTIAKMKEVVR